MKFLGSPPITVPAGAANRDILMSDASGNAAWDVLVAADIPSIDASKITTSQLALARGGTGADLSTSGNDTFDISNSSFAGTGPRLKSIITYPTGTLPSTSLVDVELTADHISTNPYVTPSYIKLSVSGTDSNGWPNPGFTGQRIEVYNQAGQSGGAQPEITGLNIVVGMIGTANTPSIGDANALRISWDWQVTSLLPGKFDSGASVNGILVDAFTFPTGISGNGSEWNGIRLAPVGTVAGTPPNHIRGLIIGNMTGAGTKNEAILTGKGEVNLGDRVAITGWQDTNQLTVQAALGQNSLVMLQKNSSGTAVFSTDVNGYVTTVLSPLGSDQSSGTNHIRSRNTSAEMITATNDRTFAGAGNWTGTNWAVSGGVLQHTAGSTADAVLANANLTTSEVLSGAYYKIAVTVSGMTTGTLIPKLGTTAGPTISANGTYNIVVTASGANVNLIFTPTSAFDGAIDNVSLTRLADVFVVPNQGTATLRAWDSSTTSVLNAMNLVHNAYAATPAANFGVGLQLSGMSDSVEDRSMARFRSIWTTATDASRKARGILSAFDTAERDAIAWEASGTAAMVGFFGTAPAVKQTQAAITNSVTSGGTTGTIANFTSLTTYATDAATIRNDIYQLALALQTVIAALRTYGLLG